MEMKSLSKQPLTIVRFYTSDEDNDSIKGKELRIEPRLKHSTIRGICFIFKTILIIKFINFIGYLNKVEKTWEPIEETSEISEEISEDR